MFIYRVDIQFHGKASHAAAFPHEGINALDAAVMAYNNVSCLRQQMKSSWRVHGKSFKRLHLSDNKNNKQVKTIPYVCV